MNRERALGSLAVMLALALPWNEALSAQTAEKAWTIDVPLGKSPTLRVENVLGSVEIRGSSDRTRARVEIQVLAEAKTAEEAARLAGAVVVDSASGEAKPGVLVFLPPDVASVRLPREGKNPVTRWVGSLFHRSADVEVAGGGRPVRIVTDRKAPGLAVRLVVAVPYDARVSVRQGVGSIRVEAARGTFSLENRDGRVDVSSVFGSVAIDAAASDVGVTLFQGADLHVRTTTGSVELLEVRCRNVRIQTTTGGVLGSALAADEASVTTGTGNVKLTGLEPRTAEIRTDQGAVDLAVRIAGMRKAVIDSAAGDVVLRVSHGLSFDLLARTPSGEVKTLGMSLDAVDKEGNVSRLRHGGGGPSFDVTAGRTLTVRPYDASRFDILVGEVGR